MPRRNRKRKLKHHPKGMKRPREWHRKSDKSVRAIRRELTAEQRRKRRKDKK